MVSLGGIGNTLMATPLLASLKTCCPHAPIDLLTTSPAASLLEHAPKIRRIIPEVTYRGTRGSAYWKTQREITRGDYGSVFYARNAILLAYIARGVLARIPRRLMHHYAFRSTENLCRLATDVIDHHDGKHDAAANVDLAATALETSLTAGPLELTISDAALDSAKRKLDALGWRAGTRTLSVFPGGTAWNREKWWPRDRYVETVRAIRAGNPDVLVLVHCGPHEADEAGAWKEELGGAVRIVEGWSLIEIAASLRFASVTLCNDSLPLHLCSALNRPVVSLFGPTDPMRTGPWLNPHAEVITPEGDWTPYFTVPYPVDPADYPAYMERISVDRVLDAVSTALDRNNAAPA